MLPDWKEIEITFHSHLNWKFHVSILSLKSVGGIFTAECPWKEGEQEAKFQLEQRSGPRNLGRACLHHFPQDGSAPCYEDVTGIDWWWKHLVGFSYIIMRSFESPWQKQAIREHLRPSFQTIQSKQDHKAKNPQVYPLLGPVHMITLITLEIHFLQTESLKTLSLKFSRVFSSQTRRN